MNNIEKLLINENLIKTLKNEKIINETINRSDIEIIKRLIVSALESFLMNLFTRRSINLQGIAWRE